MSNYKRRGEEENVLIKAMNFIQWSHYRGGMALIFASAGVFILIIFSIFVSMGMKPNYIVLGVGITLSAIGLAIYFSERNKSI